MVRHVWAVLIVLGCGRTTGSTTWDGEPFECRSGTRIIRGVTMIVPKRTDGMVVRGSIVVEGTCTLVVERSALRGDASITARGEGRVELRDVQLEGILFLYENARAAVSNAAPAGDAADFTAYADGKSTISIVRSHLRGEHPVGGNTSGVIEVSDSKLEGREIRGQQFAAYTFGQAKLVVRGGEMIGQAIAQGGGPLDLKPALWTSPTLVAIKARRYVRCLATTGVLVRRALADVAAGGTSPTGNDQVRRCADMVATLAATEPRVTSADDPAAGWARGLLPLAGKLQQLRAYVSADDEKDDGGAKGKALRAELATLAVEYDRAAFRFVAAITPVRATADAWQRRQTKTALERAVVDLVLAADDVGLTAHTAEPTGVAAALDAASVASDQLFDMLAKDPKLADRVTSLWAADSPHATTWAALESTLRALRDELKRVRRALKDQNSPVGLAQLASIGERVVAADDHLSRLTFPGP